MSDSYPIRLAQPKDINTLVAFTLEEAREAEGLQADSSGVRRGIEAAFGTPPRATYWIVEDGEGAPIASCSIVTGGAISRW